MQLEEMLENAHLEINACTSQNELNEKKAYYLGKKMPEKKWLAPIPPIVSICIISLYLSKAEQENRKKLKLSLYMEQLKKLEET